MNVPGGQWEHALQSMVGTYNVFEGARLNGVKRMAYASRAGVLPRSFYPRTVQRTADMLPKPDSYYTISKVFAESLGYMYSARHEMEVVSVRIGNFKADRDRPEHPHQLSHGDCIRKSLKTQYYRFLRDTDELQRRVQVDGLALGFGAGVFWSVLSSMVVRAGMTTPDCLGILPIMVCAYAIGVSVAAHRHGAWA